MEANLNKMFTISFETRHNYETSKKNIFSVKIGVFTILFSG